MSVYHDEVEIEDFEYDEDEETYYYPCPCGDRFQITKDDLAAGEEVATCPSCSLIIKVIYDLPRKKKKSKPLARRKPSRLKSSMGGRGRGRGRGRAGLSFNVESLGIAKGEALPEPVMQPPPVYPPLEFRPAPMDYTEGDKLLGYRQELVRHWEATRTALAPPPPKSLVDYKTESSAQTEAHTPKHNFQFQWSKFPAELRPVARKRKSSQSKAKGGKKKANITNIEDLLAQLEKKEHMDIKTEVEDDEEENEQNKEDQAEEEERELEEEEDVDEEMDEGTDYNQNYFDNGENYLDEDDDLDDGPIY